MKEKIKNLNLKIENLNKKLEQLIKQENTVYEYLEDEENYYNIEEYQSMMTNKNFLANEIYLVKLQIENFTKQLVKLTNKQTKKTNKLQTKLDTAKEEKNMLEMEYARRYSSIPNSHLIYNPNVNQKIYDRKLKEIKKIDNLIVQLTLKLEDENINLIQQ